MSHAKYPFGRPPNSAGLFWLAITLLKSANVRLNAEVSVLNPVKTTASKSSGYFASTPTDWIDPKECPTLITSLDFCPVNLPSRTKVMKVCAISTCKEV